MRWTLVCLAACYAPRPEAGVTCDPIAPACPSGQRCLPYGNAHACLPDDLALPDAAARDGAPPDGGPPLPDAAPDAVGPILDAPATCTSANLSCSDPPVVMMCNGVCYASCKTHVAFADAKVRCENWGGKLVEPRTTQVMNCLESVQQDDVWMGMQQAALVTTPAQGWTWISNPPTVQTFLWRAGDPDDADGVEDGQEQCAITKATQKWVDQACTSLQGFACER